MVARLPGPGRSSSSQAAALALTKPHVATVARSASGSFVSAVSGICTAWVWSGGGLGQCHGSGAAMKTFPVAEGQTINWSADATGRVTLTTTGVNVSPTVGTGGAAGTGVGGDINRSGSAPAGTASGSGPDFSDTYLVVGAGGDGSLWRGGNGGNSRSVGLGGPSAAITPGGGGYSSDVPGEEGDYHGGSGRVILVFTGG